MREIFRAKKIYRKCAQNDLGISRRLMCTGNSTSPPLVDLNLRVPILLSVVFELIRRSYVIPLDTAIYIIAKCLLIRRCDKNSTRK